MGDGGGRVAQVLGATDERCNGEEAKDRNDGESDEADEVV